MRFQRATLSTILALAMCGCATTGVANRPGELLVMGSIENVSAEPSDDPDDLLGHGWFNARLHVSRVMRGQLEANVIPVRYYAHTYLSTRQTRPLKLYRDEEGKYFICARPGGTGFRCPSDSNGR